MDSHWPTHFTPQVVRDGFGSGRLSTYVIALEAWRRGLNVSLHDAQLSRIEISDARRSIIFNHSCPVSLTPASARRSLRDKWSTKQQLQAAEVPVPSGQVLDTNLTSNDELRRVADQIGYPLAIKPLYGSRGKGVFTGITSWNELERTYRHLVQSTDTDKVLIEENVQGDDYRLLVVGTEVVAACKRLPANVVGDGVNSVQNLIDLKNSQRRKNPFLSRGLIIPDFEIEQSLQEQEFTLATVPAPGQRISLRRIANASAGGDVLDVTDTIPSVIKHAAEKAVAAVPGTLIAGVDVLYSPESPGASIDFAVIEMNYRPHIGVNMYPTQGTGRDIPESIIDHFFPEATRRSEAGDEMLTFQWKALKHQLTVSRPISVPPIPNHRCAYRVSAIIEGSHAELPKSQIRQLYRIADRFTICGKLTRTSTYYKLLLGGDEHNVEAALQSFKSNLNASTVKKNRWVGRMSTGFQITDSAQTTKKSTTRLQRGNEQPSIQVSLIGDVLLHANLLEIGSRDGDFTYSRQFSEIGAELVNSGIVSANLESIAAGHTFGLSGFPSFNAPEELLDGLKESGCSVMSIANNHLLDKGEDALLTSIENIRHRGLALTGAGSSQNELDDGAIVNVAGIRVGFVSFTDGAKIKVDTLRKSHINFFDGETSRSRMVRRVGQVKKQVNAIRHKCDVLILQLHFGEEYHRIPSAFQKELVTSLCELQIDAIVGHHPHVLQPIEWKENSRGKNVLVAYSLGNFFSGQNGLHRQIGGVLNFTIFRDEETGHPVFRITNPNLTLTYVDHKDSYKVKYLSDLSDSGTQLSIQGGATIDSRQVYANLAQLLGDRDGGIKIC